MAGSFRLRLFGRWLIGGPEPTPTKPAADYIVRFEAPRFDGTFYRFNQPMTSRDRAVSFAGSVRRDYALGSGSAYPIAIIGVRWKGVARHGR